MTRPLVIICRTPAHRTINESSSDVQYCSRTPPSTIRSCPVNTYRSCTQWHTFFHYSAHQTLMVFTPPIRQARRLIALDIAATSPLFRMHLVLDYGVVSPTTPPPPLLARHSVPHKRRTDDTCYMPENWQNVLLIILQYATPLNPFYYYRKIIAL